MILDFAWSPCKYNLFTQMVISKKKKKNRIYPTQKKKKKKLSAAITIQQEENPLSHKSPSTKIRPSSFQEKTRSLLSLVAASLPHCEQESSF